jgi:hypothetical protein
MRVAMLLLITLVSPASAAAPASRPATTRVAPTTTAARKATTDTGIAAVRAATIVLAREYEQYLRNPSASKGVRESSNYFLDYPSRDVTPDSVAFALQSRGGEPRTSAYVKWQLLSAIKPDEELDESVAKQLLLAYRNGPQPIQRPGISPQDQQKLDVYVQGRKAEEEPDLRAYLDAAVAQVDRQNRVILMYRDELYRRLPKAPETFGAALDDLTQRLNAVADAKDLAKMLVKDVRDWSTAEPRPSHQLLALAKVSRRLADTKGPQYYTSPSWRASSNLFGWNKSRSHVDGASSLKDLAAYLEELAQQPVLELKDKK